MDMTSKCDRKIDFYSLQQHDRSDSSSFVIAAVSLAQIAVSDLIFVSGFSSCAECPYGTYSDTTG